MNESQCQKNVVLVVDRNPETPVLLQSIAIYNDFDLKVVGYKNVMKAFEAFIHYFGSGGLLCVFMGGKLDGETDAEATPALAKKMLEMANRAQQKIFIFAHSGREESSNRLMEAGCHDALLRIADDASRTEFYVNDVTQAFVTAGAHATVSLGKNQEQELELAPA